MEGFTTIESHAGPIETMDRLEAAIKSRGMTVFARINHASLATRAGMNLRPTEVIIFGNPRGGTPLMQAKQTIGIDLPLKALVWQDESGKTLLSYHEPRWLAQRHSVEGLDETIEALSKALAAIATEAAGGSTGEGTGSAQGTSASQRAGSVTPPARLSLISLLARLVAIAAIIAAIAALFLYAGGWLTPRALTPARFTDRFEELSGRHPGFRRNHAKGVCVSGYFESNGQGATLSKASIFQPGRWPVIGRFSLSGGNPYQADAAPTVRGFGIRFSPPDGEEWRTAMVNLPVFPARTPQAFYEQLLASAPDPATKKPDPAKMQAFLAKYPESAAAIHVIQSQPKSSGFENSTFNSLNAFRFINAAGTKVAVRWSLTPFEPFTPASASDPASTDKNQLFDALIASVHHHPLQWHLIITVAAPEDPTDNATIPWPPDRQQIDVGTLTIERVESDDTSPARDINFDPLILPNGMAASDDPILSARSAVYSQSFTRREGEHKNPSAVSPAEIASHE
ncbi:MAG TPA: catalase [Verrucomicrobiae bacterium]|nr:catalase [Verrucomicrobiae bacterium]